MELDRVGARADPDLEPPARERVDDDRALEDLPPVVVRQQQHAGSESQARRDGGERGERRELGAEVAVVDAVVLGRPDRAVAETVGVRDLRENLGVVAPAVGGARAGAQVGLDAELEWRRGAGHDAASVVAAE